MDTTESTKWNADTVGEVDRLRLLNKQLKIRTLSAQLEAITQRQTAIAVEMEVLPTKKTELEKQRDELFEEYKKEYVEMKETAGVPEGSDLNLETGELVQSPQQ